MALTVAQDIARLTSMGYTLREAVRLVARKALTAADRGASYSSDYLREIHRLMVATA